MKEDPNPYLLEQAPGSWDPGFRRWIPGGLLPLVIAGWGVRSLISAQAAVFTPVRGSGGNWTPVEGLPACAWGIGLLGLALVLHGYFHWRWRATGWSHHEVVERIGGLLAVPGFLTAYAWVITGWIR